MVFGQKHHFLCSRWGVMAFLTVAVIGLMVVQSCASPSLAVPGGQQEPIVGVNIGQIAPDFTLADLDGNKVSLDDFRGKVVFINFWASWCPPCRAEMPEIESVHQDYKDKGVVTIGVDIQEPEDVVRKYVSEGGFSWTFVLDKTGEVARRYNITGIPTSFFIDREGVIRAVNIGAMTKRAMEDRLAEAMR